MPHPEVVAASRRLIRKIKDSDHLASLFQEGKMIGVLWVSLPAHLESIDKRMIEDRGDGTGFIYAFSGNVSGMSFIEGFVPPVFDLLAPGGYFLQEQEKISEINARITAIEESEAFKRLELRLDALEVEAEEEISEYKRYMMECKARRDSLRKESADDESIIRESQFQKAQLKRIRQKWKALITEAKGEIKGFLEEADLLRERRRSMSDALQSWIFRSYMVHNAEGECSSIQGIFSSNGLVPPGGTGDCAAPKLLEYAYRQGLKPLAMGEFWYGDSPKSEPRTEGCFYPSCTSKCGPLLPWMLKGLDLAEESVREPQEVRVLYRDEYLAIVSKPSGMLSVPGITGGPSVQEMLSQMIDSKVFAVHRLDMDTSGLLLFALNPTVQSDLQRQFEERTVHKLYKARLRGRIIPGANVNMESETRGRISLPLSADYDNRPRQMADLQSGREAVTDFTIIGTSDYGTDVHFMPLTGRTHQLRVHSAHSLGLSSPIVGDTLYGGVSASASSSSDSSASAQRLLLHACELGFVHPVTGENMIFRDEEGYKVDSI